MTGINTSIDGSPSGTTPDGDTPSDGSAVPVPSRRRRRVGAAPYLLLVPAVGILTLLLGYPLVRLVTISLQSYGPKQIFGKPAEWVGLKHYVGLLGNDEFYAVLWRTLLFCLVNVTLTMIIGTSLAVLLGRLGRVMRVTLSTCLLLAWATPALTATVVWQWLFDTRFGVVNRVLVGLGFESYEGHAWLSEPLSFFSVATVIVVWMGVPFVAFTLHAAMTQVPEELAEAASIDGAGPWRRFRDVTFPLVKPVVLILTALSVLWDFRVFTQIYILQSQGGINRETNLLSVWAYRTAIGASKFDVGAAIAVVMVIITLLLTLVYLRQMVRQEEL